MSWRGGDALLLSGRMAAGPARAAANADGQDLRDVEGFSAERLGNALAFLLRALVSYRHANDSCAVHMGLLDCTGEECAPHEHVCLSTHRECLPNVISAL